MPAAFELSNKTTYLVIIPAAAKEIKQRFTDKVLRTHTCAAGSMHHVVAHSRPVKKLKVLSIASFTRTRTARLA